MLLYFVSVISSCSDRCSTCIAVSIGTGLMCMVKTVLLLLRRLYSSYYVVCGYILNALDYDHNVNAIDWLMKIIGELFGTTLMSDNKF